jgi:hypothetical protein
MLLLDVDGPLNPYAAPWFRERRPEGGYEMRYLTLGNGRSYWVALNRWHGERLNELAEVCDLAWATTWQEDANRLISPVLGLPSNLPVVPLAVPTLPLPVWGWKTDQVASWAGPRPFAWLDDEITDATCARLDAASPGRHLARSVSPEVGLTEADFAAVAGFAASA